MTTTTWLYLAGGAAADPHGLMLQAPQSAGQEAHVSAPLQVPSPQLAAQGPQSAAHEVHVSAPLHVPSPQLAAQGPQSAAQEVQVSAPLHAPSPHDVVPVPG